MGNILYVVFMIHFPHLASSVRHKQTQTFSSNVLRRHTPYRIKQVRFNEKQEH